MEPTKKPSSSFRFSHRSIERLPAPSDGAASSNKEYTDSVESGLRIAVYRSGRRSFRHRYTFLGTKKLLTLGEFPAISVERARERVRANKVLLSEDIDPREQRQVQRDASTFQAFVDEHYLPFAKNERRSYVDIENRIRKRLIPTFGHFQMPRISKRDISGFHLQLRDEVSAITANRYLALTSSIFSRALELDVVSTNPCRGISKFKEGSGRKRVLSSDELDRFAKALREVLDVPSGKAIFLMMATGLRKSEVLSMQWPDVDLAGSRVFLPHTKSGVPRYVPLNSQALGLLQEMAKMRNNSIDWVFPSNSKCGHLREVRRTFGTITANAKIDAFRLHDLRRSFASILINSGVAIYEVRDLLGHADIRTTQIYAHLETTTLQGASEVAASKIQDAFQRQM